MRKKILSTDEHGLIRIDRDKSRKVHQIKSSSDLCSSVSICGLFLLSAFAIWFYLNSSQKVSAEDASAEIEKATFTRQEFFGAEAIVPLPTKEARENLARLAENSGENPAILERLAELDERLENFEAAEKNLIRLSEINAAKVDALAAFYHRHGAFEKEAQVLRKVLFTTAAPERADAFQRLLELARIHDLKQYLNADFYAQVIAENPNVHLIFTKLVDRLAEEKNYAEALKFIRQAKAQFPERKNFFLAKEVKILLEADRSKEAEAVYVAGFDPFWEDDEAEKFYEFLSNQDRLREYGAELKAKFRKNPADFDAGIKFALYKDYDQGYRGDDFIAPIILEIEAAKKFWTTAELVAATGVLLRKNRGATASRFLYTLYLREDFQKNPTQRAQILYQLFKMFAGAENQKLPLVKGDLRFYEDVARADSNPGLTTGILSLIFADSNPRDRLTEQENAANKFFNRAAAYRIFEEYKRESPTISPTLAQMYLDLVNLHIKTKEPEIAEKILNEFGEKFENSDDFADAAMKLAEGFAAMKNDLKAREIYQRVLDFTGKKGESLTPRTVDYEENSTDEKIAPSAYYSSYRKHSPSSFTDFLGETKSSTTYADVLEIYVNSLAKEKKTPEILALYSNEIAKYPNEEWLYEKRLAWLEQTNLTEEKFEFYKASLAHFQNDRWRDKLARFFLREKRNDEFAALSQDLTGRLNDAEIQNYLAQFIDGKGSATEFQKQLYLKLYQTAHERFPHNATFTNGLLTFYRDHQMQAEWRKLAAEYYFDSTEIREAFLNRLAENDELRPSLNDAQNKNGIVYEMFRADASARLSNYENAVAAYRKLDEIYPHTPEFSERLIGLTRSLGQKDRQTLDEAAQTAQKAADFETSSAERRTRSGEIFAEFGDYGKARDEWEKLVSTASGTREIYLDAATVYWDYFQFDDALRTIKNLRVKLSDENLYAFEAGAILESQKKTAAAIGEYVKAFRGNDEQREKTKKRLRKLASRNGENSAAINAAFAREITAEKSGFAALGYAEALAETKDAEKAALALNRAVAASRNTEFLEAAKNFYQTEDNAAGEQAVLKRLSETAGNPRRSIRYRLKLAKSFEDGNQRDQAKNTLSDLVRAFPVNYGVLTEAADVYRRLGYENEAVNLLRNALPKSRGAFQNALASKLSDLLIETNRLDSAEQILTKLHDENPSDAEIFQQLARVCVRTGNPALMRKAFDETVRALRSSDVKDRRELDDQIADLRQPMIDAFTRTKDFRSAIEQHIEIINRDPDDEELTENAVRYVKRYGGADVLRDYYLKLSAEAFKNYRWNVVLARIYEADNDTDNAVANYTAATVNQPEMPELYLAIADLETKRNNYDAALKNLDTVLELTNDAPTYVRKKIEILKRVGRINEIEAEKAKLPAEEENKITTNEFAEARNLDAGEREKRRELYRQAFAKLEENPLDGEMKTADLAAYVQSAREEEPLDQIAGRLWNLREKLIEISDADDSTNAGAARNRLPAVNAALTETVGGIAQNYATDDEQAALHEDLRAKIEAIAFAADRHQNLSTVQNVCVRAGFGDLEETILRKRIDEAALNSVKEIAVRNLINFYNERAAYQKTFDVLEIYALDDLPLRAEAARTIGNTEKELEALRRIYWKYSEKFAANDANVARFLEILYAERREELKDVARKSSVYQLQTINFLIGKGERELAHAAIENANLPLAWKASRHAETSLALREFGEDSECYFCAALRFDSIGNLTAQTPDKKSFLINDDWFHLTREYGEWLAEKGDASAENFLPAMTENLPENGGEQFRLGEFYLRKKDFGKAIEHLKLAIEVDNRAVDDAARTATFGAAFYLSGDENSARVEWAKIRLQDDYSLLENGAAYFDALNRFGLSREAREQMPPVIIKFLENSNAENSFEFQMLIRQIAASFTDETEKANYFRRVLEKRLTDKSLAAMLLNENLVAADRQKEFYELIINRCDRIDYGDYQFAALKKRIFDRRDAEAIYEQENGYKVDEPENERLEWQRKYLEYLLDRRENESALTVVSEIEKDLNELYARPSWLRLAKINVAVRAGKFDRADAERFVGISVPDAATQIEAPSLERFNEVRRILTAEKRDTEAAQISEAFYARKLALGQFDAANFSGFARVYFERNEAEIGLRVLRLMVDASDEAKRETALAEISASETIKARMADTAKNENQNEIAPNQADALRIAAEIAVEFNQIDSAIGFRQSLLQINPNADEKIALAELLNKRGTDAEAETLLTEVVNDRNASRAARWRARSILQNEMPNIAFDSFSQFYNGLAAVENNQNASAFEFFQRALIADRNAPVNSGQELVKIYAAFDQPYAVLKIAATDQSIKTVELLKILSEAAEKTGDYRKAMEFERLLPDGGDGVRVAQLQKLFETKNIRAVDYTVNESNIGIL